MTNLEQDPENSLVSCRSQLGRFWIALAILTTIFIKPLWSLLQLSLNSELHSHLPLIPFVSAYLIWIGKSRNPLPSAPHSRMWIFPAVLGISILGTVWYFDASSKWDLENYLATTIFAYLMLIAAIALKLFGIRTLRANTFPILFLVCLVPLPIFIVDLLEWFFQHTSAEVAFWIISLIDIPALRESWLVFRLPNITLQVATECSGIRSSLVLFIVSLVASYMFIRNQWKRLILIVLFIPRAILRNAVRVATIATLCVKMGPEMIDSWIHHQGGPFFFALSLGPFFAVLYFLWRTENLGPERLASAKSGKNPS